jgi:hypothetical protein
VSVIKKKNIPALSIIREDFNIIEILESSGNTIHYLFDIKSGVITEKHENSIISQFTAKLPFEMKHITHPDILRSAIKSWHLIKYHNYHHHLSFEFIPIDN